ncbi:MAG: nuclease A inhibitor family protein [Armatimonadetes bacterium]|nr:nuclease A inhibitor family protein [Armatimonadota bacterium]
MMPTPDPTLKRLQAAAKGLTYPSETDAPVKAFLWADAPRGEALMPDRVRQLAKLPADAPVTPLDLDQFFAPVLTEADWHGPEEQAAVRAFRTLRQTLEETLSDLQGFQIGEIEQTVLVVGQTGDGRYAGIRTKVVET